MVFLIPTTQYPVPRLGDLGIWGFGDLGIWGFGDLGIWGKYINNSKTVF
jgi:hypothetical protein